QATVRMLASPDESPCKPICASFRTDGSFAPSRNVYRCYGALKYAAAIERALCEKLGADVNYSGLICKNPFHLEWQVMEWRE
ncbi:replication initiation protein, partial [Escherichia coli]|uniref:replication initiation protein n=1 Tax=Escherichia coli TaxID=562 RepID=UPI003EE2D559